MKEESLKRIRFCFLLLFIGIGCGKPVSAQQYLSQLVSINIQNEKLGDVLAKLSEEGGFYFSYSSNVIPKDSLVSIRADQGRLEDVLNILLQGNYELKEAPNYIILREAPNRLRLISDNNMDAGRVYSITGFVVDDLTGAKLPNASVYEKNLLLSTLTDERGYFKLPIKNPESSIALTVSKEYYRDTTVILLAPVQVQAGNKSKRRYGYRPGDELHNVERTAMGRFFVSSKQKLQSLNLGGFFATTPFQTSLTPGLSTHGSLSGQVINKFSVNILGGYTSGVNGVELGGIFNISKRDVDYLQVAGVYNLVGGAVGGVQLAGANNTVLDSVKGIQVGGLYNHVKGNVRGVQIAGGLNLVKSDVTGFQIAGLGNKAEGTVRGIQVAGILNYSRNLKGVQVGLINIADTSSGTSIGLFNFIRGGYQQVLLSTNEVTNANIAFKTGTPRFYSLVMAGMNVSNNEKAYSFGVGFGHDFVFNDRLFLSSVFSSENIFAGNWKELSNLYRVKATYNLRLSKRIGVYAGPSFSVFVNDQTAPVDGYKSDFANSPGIRFNSKVKGWLGWDVGLTLF